VWGALLVVLRGGRRPGSRRILAGLLLGLTVWDLLTFAPNHNTYVPASALQPHSPVIAALKTRPGFWRLLAHDSPGPLLVPNEARLYGVSDVQGYDSLHLARYEDFWAAADPGVAGGGYFNVVVRPQRYTDC
jgi:hypothetical protein